LSFAAVAGLPDLDSRLARGPRRLTASEVLEHDPDKIMLTGKSPDPVDNGRAALAGGPSHSCLV